MVPDNVSFPTRRATAARNREKILATARAAFADPQAEVSMAEISRRAGVGMATLYRNFAGRRELLEALYLDEVNAVCDAAETVEADTPGARFEAWLHQFFAFFNNKHHVAELLKDTTPDAGPFFGINKDRVLAAGQPLLRAAQQTHDIRTDLTLEQILQMITAIAAIPGDPSHVEPMLRTTLDGLTRERPTRPRAPRRR
jgi:AcrR family transcriptional regulator